MKKPFFSALSILLIISVLFSLVSCGGGPDNETESSEQTEITEPATSSAELAVPEPNAEVDIRIGGKNDSKYKLVRPDTDVRERTKIMTELNGYIKDLCGFQLTPATDWVKNESDAPKFEILLGNTVRPETRDAMSRIGLGGYSVTAYEDKIVIAAHTREKLLEAVEYFKSGLKVVEENGENVLYYRAKNKVADADLENFFGKDNPLSSYSIVCDKSDSVVAAACSGLAREFSRIFKVDLKICGDDEPVGVNEIIVGNCSRRIASESLAGAEELQCVIRTSGNSIFIGGKLSQTTQIAVKRFTSTYINNVYTNTIIMEKNLMEEFLAYDYQDSNALAEDAEIRVMSFNLLTELWDAKVPVEGRDVIVNDIINHYSPDVIGLQEVSDKWHARLQVLFGGKYIITDKQNGKGKTNFSTLAYNVEKVEMLEHGVTVFSSGNDQRLRLATWGLFRQKDSGKKYIVMSTHWDLGKNAEYQLVHSREMGKLANHLKEQYSVPVITTGDYNSNEESEPYLNYVKITGFRDAKYNCAVLHRECKTSHSLGTLPQMGSGLLSIDHIFGSEGVEFRLFNVLVDDFVCNASDHNPIYADIKLN